MSDFRLHRAANQNARQAAYGQSHLVTLTVALDTADPPVSPYLRNLYVEYAQRMGQKEALELWHQNRAEGFRHPAIQNEVARVSDILRRLDQTDALLESWNKQRDAVTAAKPFDVPETPTAPKQGILWESLHEPMGVIFSLILCLSIGAIFGLVWSFLQRGGK